MKCTKNIFCLLFAFVGALNTAIIVSLPEALESESLKENNQIENSEIDQQKILAQERIAKQNQAFQNSMLQKTLDKTTNDLREIRIKQGPIRFWDTATVKNQKIDAIRNVYLKNAGELQRYWNLKQIRKIIVPVESETLNNPESFTYDVIKINPKQFEELEQLRNQIDTTESQNIIEQIVEEIKTDQPELKLNKLGLTKSLINYVTNLPNNRIQPINPNKENTIETNTGETQSNIQSSDWQQLKQPQIENFESKEKNIPDQSTKNMMEQLMTNVNKGLKKLKENEPLLKLTKNQKIAAIRKIYQDNQQKLQKTLNEKNIPEVIISIESESRNNPESFTFDIVNLNPEQLKTLKEYQKTKLAETDSYENYIKNQENIKDVVKIASEIKESRPNLKLKTAQLAQSLLRYAEKLPVKKTDRSTNNYSNNTTQTASNRINRASQEKEFTTDAFNTTSEKSSINFTDQQDITTSTPEILLPNQYQNAIISGSESTLTNTNITPNVQNALKIFQIEEQALNTLSLDYLRKKYRELALKNHPDKAQNNSNSTQKFQELQNAYDSIVQYLKSEKPKTIDTITFTQPLQINDRVAIIQNPSKSLSLNTDKNSQNLEEMQPEKSSTDYVEPASLIETENEEDVQLLNNDFTVLEKNYDDAELVKELKELIELIKKIPMIPENVLNLKLSWLNNSITALDLYNESLEKYWSNASPEVQDLLGLAEKLLGELKENYVEAGAKTAFGYFKYKITNLLESDNINDDVEELQDELKNSDFSVFLNDADKQEIIKDIEKQALKVKMIKEITDSLQSNTDLNKKIEEYISNNNNMNNLRYNRDEQKNAIQKLKLDLSEKIKQLLSDASLYTQSQWLAISKSSEIYNQVRKIIIDSYSNKLNFATNTPSNSNQKALFDDEDLED